MAIQFQDPHSIECGFYQLKCFSNIDIMNKTKLFVDVKGNYYKAYLQTKKGEYNEIYLNEWIDLTPYYDSNKLNVIILFYPDGDFEPDTIKDPEIVAILSPDRSYYDVTIKYVGSVDRLYRTSDDPTFKTYMGSFKIYNNCILYAQSRIDLETSNEVSEDLNGIDTSFVMPVITYTPNTASDTVTITVSNWGVSDSQQIEITYI